MLLSSHPCLLNQLYIQDLARVKAQGKIGGRQQCRNAWAKHAAKSHLHMEMHECVVHVCLLSIFIFMILLFTAANAGPSLKNKKVKKGETHTLRLKVFQKCKDGRKKIEAFERHLPLQQVPYIKKAWIGNIYRQYFYFKLSFSKGSLQKSCLEPGKSNILRWR